MTDFRHAARRLLATPLFTLCAVLSLALGVGVTTAAYSAVQSVFLRDLGIDDPDRVAYIVTPESGRLLRGSISGADFDHLQQAQRSFRQISASALFQTSVASRLTTELLLTEAVDGDYFATLGVTVARGRAIQRADDARALPVVVVSHLLWRSRFAADPAIIGKTIRIGGHPFDVIGVAPRSFEGAIGGPVATKIWIPLSVETLVASPPSVGVGSQPERRPLLVFGRLASAVTVDMATAEIKGIAANLDAVSPLPTRSVRVRPEQRPWTAKSIAEIAEQDDAMRRFGLTLVALVALVLVVACTNLSNLVLARGTLRQQDFTVRYALGASRWRLVREQCAESLLLAIAGGLASYVVFHGLSRLIDLELHFPLPGGGRWTWSIQPSLDMTALLVAGTSLLLALVVFGLEPALQLTRPRDLRGRLAEGSGGTANPRLQRQRVLIRWQVAIAAGFFVIATMFIKYTIAEMRHDPGLDLDRLALGFLNLKTPEWDEARVRRTLDRVAQEVGQDPAIESVSVSTGMPFGSPSVFRLSLATPETMNQDPRYHHPATGIGATPSIFRTLGVPIVHGRGFDDRDQQGSAPVVVMSAFTARALFGTSDAVGRQLMVRTQSSRGLVTIIGVARDTDVGGLMREPRAFIYLPFTQHYDPSLIVAVRSTGDQAAAMRALRDALHRADPDLAVDAIGPSRSLLAAPFVLLRAVGVGTVSLGLLTLLVAMGGLFALQSHAVIRRTREIGLRMSFGANDVQIKRMVLQDGYRPVLEGLALGVFMGLAGRVLMRRYLEIDVAVIDPWMLFGVPLPLILAAFFACYFPARRAAAVAPSVALRHL